MENEISNEKILSALSKNVLFKYLSRNQVEEFLSLLTVKTFKANEEIIKEGSTDKTLYILISGAAAINKYDPELKHEVRVVTLHSGDSFGEMSLFDENPRFASVKALFDCELIALTVENLDFFRSKGMSTYSVIMTNVARQLNERLRRTTEVSVSVSKGVDSERFMNSLLTRKAHKLKIQLDSSKVFIFSIFSVVAYLLITTLVSAGHFNPSLDVGIKGLSLIAIILLYASFLSPIGSYSNYARRLYDFRKSHLVVLLIVTIALLGYFSLCHWILMWAGFEKLLVLPAIGNTESIDDPFIYTFIVSMVIIFSSFVQEFVVRLGFYLPMTHLLRGAKLRWIKIFMSSMLLLILYSKFNMLPIFVMLIPNLVWGYLFSRGYNLIGLSISHSLFNLWGFYVLGLSGILLI